MAGIIVVSDFDKTIIDCDSDNWVIDDLGATHLLEQLLLFLPWNTAMDRVMTDLHAQGKNIDDIAAALRRSPLHSSTVSAIKSAYALGCELRIVSDANIFFIETILKQHGLLGCFSEINTNPSFIDDEGRLRILPFHDFSSSSSHGCPLCPPNMCKGKIIERIQSEGKKRFIYLGDGKGDFCPALKLVDGDCVMPRKGFPVWELIAENRVTVKAEVHEWSDFEEQERVLLQLINRLVLADINGAPPLMECKPQTAPISRTDSLPKALPVRP